MRIVDLGQVWRVRMALAGGIRKLHDRHTQSRYDELVALGQIQPASGNLTAGDWRQFTHFEVPEDVDPLAVLLKLREGER